MLIMNQFPELNEKWLRYGEGNMFTDRTDEGFNPAGVTTKEPEGNRRLTTDELKKTILELQKEVELLRALLAEKDARLAEKERIIQLLEQKL